MTDSQAGKLADRVINKYKLQNEFFAPSQPVEKVKFGTSGHRGKLGAGFSCFHAEAIAQAVARFHAERGISDSVMVGGDTRLMSRATADICAQVLAANGINVLLPQLAVPTPVFSFFILNGAACASLNGTASHNPPEDMGLKYNPSHGGPAGGDITAVIERYANEYLENPKSVKKMTLRKAFAQGLVSKFDVVGPYTDKISQAVDLESIKTSGLRIAIHSLGGASAPFYAALSKKYGIKRLKLVEKTEDPTFGFIPQDHDGKIRMDPSSVYPMSPLLNLLKDGKFDFAGASDPDADRFGAATPGAGLVSPNSALSVLLQYLLSHRPGFPAGLKAARTIGTTQLMDRICKAAGREIEEVNVGFKYFVDGLKAGRYLLAGEESAGLSVHGWTTEKDGILAVLLLAEVMAKTGEDLSALYAKITARHGNPAYKREDIAISDDVRKNIKALNASHFKELKQLAGQPVLSVRDTDGLKIYLENGWLLVRLSGTEPIAKLYAESFAGEAGLAELIDAGRRLFVTTTSCVSRAK